MSYWKRKKIGEILNFKRGYDLPSSSRAEGEIPIISSAGISDYHNEYKKKGEGIVTGRYGTLGEVFYINGEYWPLNTTLYVTDFKGNYPKFIYYFLKTLKLERFNGAAAVPGLDRNVLHKVEVLFNDDVKIQKKIASILSSYDELIENNKQRISHLEEMAEEIYKEWFVRLRFPGYENTKIVDGLPEGWEIVKIKELVLNKKSKYIEEEHSDLGIYDLSRMPRKSLEIPSFGKHDELESSRIIFEENDILFGSIRSYFHKVSCANKKGITNVSVLVFRPRKDIYRSYSLLTFFSSHFINWSINFSNGTKMPTISWKEVQNYSINKPTDCLLKFFDEMVFPLIKEIHLLSDKNQLLHETRDLLLPRLISGKLSVEHLVEKEELMMVAEGSNITKFK